MKYLLSIPLALSIAACANEGANYRPILDGPATAGYSADLSACQSLARNKTQMRQNALKASAVGAGAGAVLGKLDEDGDPVGGAIAGALAGGAASAVETQEQRKNIVIECLRGRGHRVVG